MAYNFTFTYYPLGTAETTYSIPTIRAQIERAKRFDPQTEILRVTFSTPKITANLSRSKALVMPAGTPTMQDLFMAKREGEILYDHISKIQTQRNRIDKVQRISKILSRQLDPPQLEYITSIQVYAVLMPDQGYYHDHKNIGSDYRHFAQHKIALDSLATLLAQQTALCISLPPQSVQAASDWQENVEGMTQKIGEWCKEMEWVDAAFIRGYRSPFSLEQDG
ncbi:MAG: hypothetical protein Q9199_001654 [Rusavskia elegans]